MKLLANLLLVLGFCVGTVGAAGFAEPRESLALPLLAIGLAGVFAGGFLVRWARRATVDDAAPGAGGRLGPFRDLLEKIRVGVEGLDREKESIPSEVFRDRIDRLLREEYFDLTSRNDELLSIVGFAGYARVWEGVATAERLLARAWSMATDGYVEEGWGEIPIAHEHLERSAKEMAGLSG